MFLRCCMKHSNRKIETETLPAGFFHLLVTNQLSKFIISTQHVMFTKFWMESVADGDQHQLILCWQIYFSRKFHLNAYYKSSPLMSR